MSHNLHNEMARCQWKPVRYPHSEFERCHPESSPSGHQIAYVIQNIIGFYDPKLMCSSSKHLKVNCSDIDEIKYSPSGKILAATGCNIKWIDQYADITYNTIHLFDCINYKLLKILEGHERAISTIDFSQDGSQIISGDYIGLMRIWDLESGRSEVVDQRVDESDNKVQCVKYLNNDVQFLSSGKYSGIIIWSVANKSIIKQFKFNDEVINVQVRQLEIISQSRGKQIYFWNTQSGSNKKLMLKDNHYAGGLIANSQRSRLILVISYEYHMMRLCCGTSKKMLNRKNRSNIGRAQFSPDGTYILEGNLWAFSIRRLFE